MEMLFGALTISGVTFIFIQCWRFTRLCANPNRLFFSAAAMFISVPATLGGILLQWPRDTMLVISTLAVSSVGFWGWCSARLRRKGSDDPIS